MTSCILSSRSSSVAAPTASWSSAERERDTNQASTPLRVNLVGLTAKGPPSWGTAAAICQEAQEEGNERRGLVLTENLPYSWWVSRGFGSSLKYILQRELTL